MNPKQRTIVVCLLAVSLLISGCGPGQLLGPTLTPTLVPTATSTPTPKPTTGGIEGKFFRSDIDKPIANASISLFLPDTTAGDSEMIEAITDAQGAFSFTEMKPDTYNLAFLLVLKGQSTFPCENFSFDVSLVGGNPNVLSPGGEITWMSATGTKNGDAALLVHSNQDFSIMAGDVLQLELKLECR